MAGVVGLTVWVKLKHPQNSIVYGVVKDLVPNSHLTLANVRIPGSNTTWDHWSVQSTAIENIEVIDPGAVPASAPAPISTPTPIPSASAAPTPFASLPTVQPGQAHPPEFSTQQSSIPLHAQPPAAQPAPAHVPRTAADQPAPRHVLAPTELPSSSSPVPTSTPQRQASTFVDPAIVSFGAASPVQKRSTSRPAEVETPIKSMLARAAQNLPSPGSPFIAEAGKANVTQKLAAATRQTPVVLAQPKAPVRPGNLSAEAPVAEDINPDVTQPEAAAKKKVRRGQKSKKQGPTPIEAAEPPPVMNVEVSRNGNDMNGSVKRGKGWRSTPLLQPSPQTISPLDRANTKKSRRKQKEEQEFAQGDTTDIQDMGDFDFVGELMKFDKKQVFDEIRQGDTTADEDRLVSHNKVHRPGTYGGKNLHPTESVLSPKLEANSIELDNSSDADTELNLANGRSSSKHSVSRTVFPKTKPSRQNSAQYVDSKPHPLSASISSDRNFNRSATSLVHRAKAASLATSSPRPDRANSPHSGVSTSRMADSIPDPSKALEPHFAIAPHMSACPTLHPGALERLEAATVSTFSLAHESITESAARCIAEAAMQLSDLSSGPRRPSRTITLRGSMTASGILGNSSETQTVVVLAGNHVIGARALAAARQLLGRNFNIIAAESLFESADTQDLQVKAQTTILRRMARGGANIKRGLWRKASNWIKNLNGPPVVIIDALLAGSTYESLLSSDISHSTSVQQETREMIDWANRSRAPVISVGCPSGVSGVTGVSTLVDGEPLAVRPDKILALGAPMQGLLKAMESGEKWDVSVADIGINIALKSEEAVAFGGPWVVDLKYVDDEAEA